ncbi:hypothetical protein PHMEG_00024228 [Phytophthora megakarya]|uniref:PiggyBac transposable element-derived protein domain-containing protein n=1 Tax=Phytophthora megakarya TaxID=4795 RepID=A0A225VGP0_9STRA|nr:hypothetical protein PHMEG_00024228 [Phytophthora megakarya]
MNQHWNTKELGVILGGRFGRVMQRVRFREISRFIHFPDNTVQAAATDTAWKIRSVLAVLEKAFKEGYVLGSRVAIDECVLPSHGRHNPTRTFMKDKPHHWGSKCVMTCWAETGYCKRVKLDIGRAGDNEDSQSMDTKNGPAAIIRNITCAFRRGCRIKDTGLLSQIDTTHRFF